MLHRTLHWLAFVALALVCCRTSSAEASLDDLTVATEAGMVRGVPSEDIVSFKGIPFAAPPIGALRWRAPQPVVPWTGVRDASAYGHDCMQVLQPGDAPVAGTEPSEDCLVLNVWRPAQVTQGEKLPVMVWIHGGGYVNGGTSMKIYDGSGFARQGVILVSANYRLGRFGFFAHPALLCAHEGSVGNFAYMDQIAALRWVKRNIAAFGGDPGRVTIFGESAGGDSVLRLLGAAQAKDLFQRAIVMSGHGRGQLSGGFKLTQGTPSHPSADQIGVNFAAGVGILGEGPETLNALRALSAEQVAGDLTLRKRIGPLTYTMGPIVDGELVAQSPEEMLLRGAAGRVPLMIGTTSNDLPIRFPPAEDPWSYFGADADKAREAYNPSGTAEPHAVLLTIGADITMHEPARFVARQMTRVGVPVWLYRFDYVPQSLRSQLKGANHAMEVPFAFDTVHIRYGEATTDEDRIAARSFSAYFVNFARRGDPNGAGLPIWPKFEASRYELMLFTPDNGPVYQVDPWTERLRLTERAADAQAATRVAAASESRATQSAPAQTSLENTHWKLAALNGTAIKPSAEGKAADLMLDSKSHRVSGFSGCNRFMGSYSLSEDRLTFGQTAGTMMACAQGMDLERAFLAMLNEVRKWKIRDRQLDLLDEQENSLARFEAAP